jgi:hypothetical protein
MVSEYSNNNWERHTMIRDFDKYVPWTCSRRRVASMMRSRMGFGIGVGVGGEERRERERVSAE